MAIKIENNLFSVIEYQHVKPGKGSAFVRTKLRNLKTGNVLEKTFRSVEKIEDVFMEMKNLQFLYRAGDDFHFLDHETYEQLSFSSEEVGQAQVGYLKENMDVVASFCEGKFVSIQVPMFVVLKVTNTEPGVKGDTAKSGTKPATLETGLSIQVPLFIENGTLIKIDTRTGEYVNRA
jgi:elongation factor P